MLNVSKKFPIVPPERKTALKRCTQQWLSGKQLFPEFLGEPKTIPEAR
jgi:hypothetical protein